MTVKVTMEKQMECRMAEETEVLGENLPLAPLLSITKSGPPRWEAGDYPPELCRGLKTPVNICHISIIYYFIFNIIFQHPVALIYLLST
jgi:hypothetical protein